MSVLRSVTAAGLIALTLGGVALTSAETANARPYGAAIAGGLAGGIIGGALAAQAVAPAYPVYPAYPAYYAYPPAYAYPVYYRGGHCWWTWERDRWGHRHHIRVCR